MQIFALVYHGFCPCDQLLYLCKMLPCLIHAKNAVQCKQIKDLPSYRVLWFTKGYTSLLYLFFQSYG